MNQILIKATQLFCLLCLLASSAVVSAQDIILKVKKGNANIANKSFNEQSASVTMKTTDVLELLAGSLVIARQDVIIVELVSGKTYSHAEISALIKKKKQAASGGLTTVAFKDPIQKTNPTPLKGSSTRGDEKDNAHPDFYYPYDNMLVTDAAPEFLIGNVETTLTTNITLKNTGTNEVYYDKMPENNTFVVENLPAGDYEWTYSIEYHDVLEKTKKSFTNTFKVPTEQEKKEIDKQVAAFKKEIKGFSDEMQQILLLEFCVENNIYAKP